MRWERRMNRKVESADDTDARRFLIGGNPRNLRIKSGLFINSNPGERMIVSQRSALLFSAKISDVLQRRRLSRCSKVLSVTFCSPSSMRWREDEETPSFRAKAGYVSSPRRFRRNCPSCFCMDAAIEAVCRDRFPTCGKST